MSVKTSGQQSASVQQYRMPDAGEGLTEAEIVTWRVAVGDTVNDGDIVVEVETAKSLVELPCPFTGTVVDLLAAEGETVAVGAPILAVRTEDASASGSDGSGSDGSGSDGSDDAGSEAAGSAGSDGSGGEPSGDRRPATSDGTDPAEPPHVGPTNESAAHPSTQAAAGAGRTAVLVGYGPAAGATRRRARRVAEVVGATGAQARSGEPVEANGAAAGAGAGSRPSTGPVLAKPPVRKLAKDLGVDLASVAPSGPGGVVTREDVLAASGAGEREAAAAQATAPATGPRAASGEERRIPVKGVRRHTAEAMVTSAFTAPHVTEWVQVDVTASVELLERLRGDRAMRDLRLSPFTLVARAMCLAARRHPEVNVSWDQALQEIVVHPEVNLGFAAATGRGLVVPVVRGADGLDVAALAAAIGELVDTARAGTIQPSQMSGGTLTATNVGVFGVDGGTPILPPGTGLILACGQVRRMPWVVGSGDDERVVPRDVMTLAVSFDHRMIDGELGSKYLADVARLLAEPGYGLVWG